MEEKETLEHLVRNLRERLASYAISIVDLETLLEIEKNKNSELNKSLNELKEKLESDKKSK
jgi:CII-binding regulator of phage lambda lysogenization HflD